jgi:hypothetical protein
MKNSDRNVAAPYGGGGQHPKIGERIKVLCLGADAALTRRTPALKLAAISEMILGIDLGTTNSAMGVEGNEA